MSVRWLAARWSFARAALEFVRRWHLGWGLPWGSAILAASISVRLFLVREGSPIHGGDFLQFWAGAKLGALGQAARAYDPAFFNHFMRDVIGGIPVPSVYSYPPTATLLWLPLSWLSFRLALISWLAAGTAVCAVLLVRIVRRNAAVLLAFGAPAALFDTWLAQDGHLTAALFAGGLLLIERSPVLAGICLGALCYKPHLAVFLPIALLSDRRWGVFCSATATVIALLVGSLALFGPGAWSGWLGSELATQVNVLTNPAGWGLDIASVYGAARLLGVSGPLAWGAQAASASAAALAVWSIWRNNGTFEDKAAGLAVATFLCAPYFRGYDEVLLVFGAVWIEAARGNASRVWRKAAAAALLLLPVVSRLGAAALLTLPVASRIGAAAIVPFVTWLVLGALAFAGGLQCTPFRPDTGDRRA